MGNDGDSLYTVICQWSNFLHLILSLDLGRALPWTVYSNHSKSYTCTDCPDSVIPYVADLVLKYRSTHSDMSIWFGPVEVYQEGLEAVEKRIRTEQALAALNYATPRRYKTIRRRNNEKAKELKQQHHTESPVQ